MGLEPEKLARQAAPRTGLWVIVVLAIIALAIGIPVVTHMLRPPPIAARFYACQLEWEHGLSLGSAYSGREDFVSQLAKRGFNLRRVMSEDDFEFDSPGNVYLLRVKTDGARVTSLYHYLLAKKQRPDSRPCFLGNSLGEVKKALGEPSLVMEEQLLTYRYELADADLSITFGDGGWVIETVLQRPIARRPTPDGE
ncbi:MAG: hypothetical protein A2Y63_04805 [Candidatus Riflebacteria bacterium RBG_13_59_9]|nr:MAG: hypothetical protein A2Y63_04805 [Candidatus Riflebacteria bacterium RBG_13_59_9]